ncbi:MAG: type II toxin-antitoxin system PemK/MazF family toxin [Lamprobacter sp.]|uniref:type II toxin-antitoxin system PemK/MazF family toxin n=1 Tax=Lamprobacter sp. TaxID=3100796 RepID=UPI002B25F06E|nr:type II toxin-antitoxin system PemK/MazF family toxin [Lamprobacter sp.]MEA3642028.1 type II toxin-antitoxin system PemK/MazF family toxin [Lamprobacter sp.]
MPLTFHPHPGMVLICDFNTGFKAPEMIKRRPVVVISPRPRRTNQLCTIVPLSTTAPNPVEPFHHRMDPRSLPGKLARKETWAKCDMLATVSLERLDRVMIGKAPNGKRIYLAEPVLDEDFKAIRRGVMMALGMIAPA